MKKTGAIFLFICMLLTALPGYGYGAPVEMTDEMIEQMTASYLNMDIDAVIKMAREAGAPVDEKAFENMRNMQKMARDGTLGDFLRGGAPELEEEAEEQPPIGEWLYSYTGGIPYLSTMKLGVAEIDNAPDTEKALEIAKKYYDMCLPKVEFGLKPDLDRLVNWTPDFSGQKTDPGKAVSLSAAAALAQRMTDAAYYYTALSAAVFELDPGGAAGAINLATAIATAGEDLEAKRTPGINRDEFYRDALSMYCHALIAAEPDEGEHVITALTSVGALLWDMGNLAAAEKVLAAVVEMDPYCCEAFDLLYNLYVSTDRLKKAWELRLKSPTRPLFLAVQRAREADEKTLKDVEVRGYLQVYNEADIEALAEQIDKIDLMTLGDYYKDIDPSAAADVRRHAKNMKDMMKGLTPPDLAKDPMFSSYNTYWASVTNGAQEPGAIKWDWAEKASQLSEKEKSLYPAYIKKFGNLMTLLSMKNDYLNPNDMEFQKDNIASVITLIAYFTLINQPMRIRVQITFPEMTGLAEKKRLEMNERQNEERRALEERHEAERARYDPIPYEVTRRQEREKSRLFDRQHNEHNDHCTAVFANAMNLALPVYESFRNAAIKCHPAVMARIMMISDEDVQQYYLTMWEKTLTDVTCEAIGLLDCAISVLTFSYWPRRVEEAEMADPQPTRRSERAEAEGPSNEDLARRHQAYLDFYSGKIDENSRLYKKMDEMYGAEVDLFFFKFRINEFITRTTTKIDLGFASGQLGTYTNHMRDTTSYDGTVKIGVSRKINDQTSISAGASGSLALTIDGNGDVVPNSLQWKAGLEAGAKGGSLSLKGGVSYGSDGGYATLRGELSRFGGSIGGGIEATASKGTRLSGDASVSNDAVKDAAKTLAGDTPGGRQASGNFGGFHDNFARTKKTLWKGEYVLPQ